MKIGQHLIKL